MRVLNPGPGEIIDRMTVLDLKIKAASADQKAVEDFCAELGELRTYLGTHFLSVMENFHHYYNKLSTLNGIIWNCIDVGHNFALPHCAYARNAKLTVRMNDQRAALISEINAAAGLSRKEKFIK